MLQLSDIVMLLTLTIVIYLWWYSLGTRQIAIAIARNYCSERELHLLDDTVALTRLWFKRDARQHWQWWQFYVFEFTANGNDRYGGSITLLGRHLQSIELDPYRI